MISSHFIISFCIIGLAVSFLLDHVLEAVDFVHRRLHGTEIPEEISGMAISKKDLELTCIYEDSKYFSWIPSATVAFALRIVLILSGYYVFIFRNAYGLTESIYLTVILFALLQGIPDFILQLPFSLYNEFVRERKFGFSNMTFSMWCMDLVKSFIVSAIILVPLLLSVSFIVCHFSSSWWLIFATFYLAFSLIVSYVYPTIIAPIFNKFTPLEDGELRERIESLFEKTGFHTSGIFVMDASRRSNHSNAYFTGLGKNKRIVLYDTLLKQLSVDEVLSVLAHELGHCKHHHVTKRLFVMIVLVYASLFLADRVVNLPALYEAFGVDAQEMNSIIRLFGIFLLGLCFEGYSWIFSVLSNISSRRDEFQADSYARNMMGTGEYLVTALIKLNKENMSEISVPKIYSLFNYSHPPLVERIKNLR